MLSGLTVLVIVFGIINSVTGQTYVHPNRWNVDTLLVIKAPGLTYQIPENHYVQPQSIEIQKNSRISFPDVDYRLAKSGQIRFYGVQIGRASCRERV